MAPSLPDEPLEQNRLCRAIYEALGEALDQVEGNEHLLKIDFIMYPAGSNRSFKCEIPQLSIAYDPEIGMMTTKPLNN